MPNDPNNDDRNDHDKFDLDAPQEDFSSVVVPKKFRSEDSNVPPPTPSTSDEKYKPKAWKGFEQEAVAEPEFHPFAEQGELDNEIDMTPMVDVTFLLLIFFMVTASFMTQRAAEQPPTQDDVPSTVAIVVEDQSDYVEVIVDQNNNYRIAGRNFEEVEAPSDTEMKSILADAKQSTEAVRLIISAHDEATHQRVVTAWDYGKKLQFEQIQIQTTTKEY